MFSSSHLAPRSNPVETWFGQHSCSLRYSHNMRLLKQDQPKDQISSASPAPNSSSSVPTLSSTLGWYHRRTCIRSLEEILSMRRYDIYLVPNKKDSRWFQYHRWTPRQSIRVSHQNVHPAKCQRTSAITGRHLSISNRLRTVHSSAFHRWQMGAWMVLWWSKMEA